jgi:UDP-N-acetylmuramate-alanine ligase
VVEQLFDQVDAQAADLALFQLVRRRFSFLEERIEVMAIVDDHHVTSFAPTSSVTSISCRPARRSHT